MSSSRPAGKVGAFAAINQGKIDGCAAEIHLAPLLGGAGFVFENQAEILRSLSLRAVKGRQAQGFYVRNGGSICSGAYRTGEKDFVLLGCAEGSLPASLPPRDILEKLGLDQVWKLSAKDQGLAPDLAANHREILDPQKPIIRIDSADDLKHLIQVVNSGDQTAASSQILLTRSLNLKGAALAPLGDSESCPFTGLFDGGGHTIRNFTIPCRGREVGGFFGCTENATVANLALDGILKGKGGGTVGGMAGLIKGGLFVNCQIRLSLSPGMCSGGFCGKNTGRIQTCYVGGRIAPPIPLLPWLIPCLALLLAALGLGAAFLLRSREDTPVFYPEVIDPNQTPVVRPSGQVDPPPSGTSRISLELNHDIYVRASTMVGEMDYVNPHRSTQDVVIRLCISDAELQKAGYDPVACQARTEAETQAEGYDPEQAFTVLYQSQRLQVGYQLSYCKLSPLPNGEPLKVGDYDLVMLIDAYDPQTNEKAIVNAQAATTVHILDQ